MEIPKTVVFHRGDPGQNQLPGMLRALNSDEVLPPIELIRDARNVTQIMVGHHRLSATWL